MNTKRQGDIGVAAAILYYTKLEYTVSAPLTDAARYDLIVDKYDGKLYRVQCKTSSYVSGPGFNVQLATSGGNQSWNGKKKYISSEECDLVFVWCTNDSLWEIPVAFVDGKASFKASEHNLQFLIQGETLGTEKIIIEKYCECGAKISKKAVTCRTCIPSTNKIEWPSKEEILSRLESSNYSKLGRELGVTDNAIRKHLAR